MMSLPTCIFNFALLTLVIFSSNIVESTYSPSEPEERIADASIIENLKDKANCVGSIALEITAPTECTATGKYYDLLCTFALIGRKTLLSNANCVKKAMITAKTCNDNFNYVCRNPTPAIIMGMRTNSADDIAAATVFRSFVKAELVVYHTNYDADVNDMNYDLVVIKLDTEVPESVCPQPFFIPSARKNDIAPGPFMLSWGQPACTGRSDTGQTYAKAPTTTACSAGTDGFTKGVDQNCLSLQRVQDASVKPRTTRGDMGSPIYFAQIAAGLGNVAEYIVCGVLGKSPKEDPAANPFGEGCSKTSIVPATDLLNPANIAFLASIKAAQGDIATREIPMEFQM